MNEIEKFALETEVPIIRKEMQTFLRFLLTLKKPMKILEVGTAIGFSALLMSEYAPKDCKITTIEKYENIFDQRVYNTEIQSYAKQMFFSSQAMQAQAAENPVGQKFVYNM